MIVAGIFKKLFEGMELTYNEYSSTMNSYTEVTKPVQFHWGDNKELAKWIHGRNGKEKYPLIWYVLENVENSNADTMTTNVCFLLFTATKTEYYNDTRAILNYENILEPLTIELMKKAVSNNIVTLLHKDFEDTYKTFDIPNYGVDLDRFDFTSNLKKGTASVTVDIVDARKVDFKARFNKANINCLT